MEIKIRNIVRLLGTNEIYEVDNIIGELLLCKPINVVALKEHRVIPIKKSEVEVIMDKETDAFNLLFKDLPGGSDEENT
jgi:hypothetical protein